MQADTRSGQISDHLLPGISMERKTAHDFDQELLILFDAYVHGGLDRRGFLELWSMAQ